MPDIAQKPLKDVPKNLDKALWDFLDGVHHNLSLLGGFKGTNDNKGVTFGDITLDVEPGIVQIVSVTDIDDPAPELATLSSSTNGDLLIAARADEYTVYSWRTATVVPDSPYVLTGNGGGWIAIAGKYIQEDVHIDSLTASRIVATGGDKKLISLADPLIVGRGGTGRATLTDGGLLVGNAAAAIVQLARATNGQIPIGSAGADPVLAAILGTANQITITLGAGSITISAPQDLHTAATPLFNEIRANDKAKLTNIGGLAIALTNTTGVVTIAGQLVKADTTTDDGVVLAAAGDTECFGVFLDAGIADDAEAWVVVSGIADVAFDDNIAAVRGNWVATGAAAGYARTQASPAAAPQHFEEIGHSLENVSAGGGGTHILGRCVLHFN